MPGERHWSWYRKTHCQIKGTIRGIVWHILTHDHVGNEYKISTNSETIIVFDNIYEFVSIGNARLLTSMWLITLLGQTWHCCSFGGLLKRFCSILCRSIIKMATISRGYVNLLPLWYFKITLNYIIHVLVLFQAAVFVCRFEIVTNQGPIKLKQVITWRCIQQQKYISIKRKYKIVCSIRQILWERSKTFVSTCRPTERNLPLNCHIDMEKIDMALF